MSMRSVLAAVLFVTLASVSFAQIVEETVTAEIKNAGFEEPSIVQGAVSGVVPDKWFYFTSTAENRVGVTDAKKRTGSQSASFRCLTATNSYQGIAAKFLAKAGDHYALSIYAISSAEDPLVGASFGQISVEWKNDAGTEISRAHGPTWTFDLPANRWEKFTIEADAPDGTAQGTFVITFFSQDGKGQGTFYLDDAELVTRPAP